MHLINMSLATYLLYANVFFVASAKICPNFSCLSKNDQLVLIQDLIFTCPGDLTCNRKEVDDCRPCVDNSCDFVCIDKSSLVSAEKLYTCPEGYYCNGDKEVNTDCNWCLPLPCNHPKVFSCVTRTAVSMFGLLLNCVPGKVCNDDWVSPCAICVDDNGNAPTTTELPPITTTEGIIGTTPLPDCNDGSKKLCRPHSSSVYVKCFAAWTGDFISQTRNCSDLSTDLICQQEADICV